MTVIKRFVGLPFRFGGTEHSGWLPPGAAKPLPTPIEDVVLDVEIEAIEGGFILFWESRDGSTFADSWYQTLEHAEEAARHELGIARSMDRRLQQLVIHYQCLLMRFRWMAGLLAKLGIRRGIENRLQNAQVARNAG